MSEPLFALDDGGERGRQDRDIYQQGLEQAVSRFSPPPSSWVIPTKKLIQEVFQPVTLQYFGPMSLFTGRTASLAVGPLTITFSDDASVRLRFPSAVTLFQLLQHTVSLFRSFASRPSVLLAGCGTGYLALLLHRLLANIHPPLPDGSSQQAKIVGWDSSAQLIHIANAALDRLAADNPSVFAAARSHDLVFQTRDVTWPIASDSPLLGSFDVIVVQQNCQEDQLRQFLRYLRPNGRVLIPIRGILRSLQVETNASCSSRLQSELFSVEGQFLDFEGKLSPAQELEARKQVAAYATERGQYLLGTPVADSRTVQLELRKTESTAGSGGGGGGGRARDALAAFAEAIDFDETSPVAYAGRSLASELLGALDQAIVDARACVQRQPDWYQGYYLLARYLMQLGRHAEARDAVQRARQLAPANAEVQELERTIGERVGPTLSVDSQTRMHFRQPSPPASPSSTTQVAMTPQPQPQPQPQPLQQQQQLPSIYSRDLTGSSASYYNPYGTMAGHGWPATLTQHYSSIPTHQTTAPPYGLYQQQAPYAHVPSSSMYPAYAGSAQQPTSTIATQASTPYGILQSHATSASPADERYSQLSPSPFAFSAFTSLGQQLCFVDYTKKPESHILSLVRERKPSPLALEFMDMCRVALHEPPTVKQDLLLALPIAFHTLRGRLRSFNPDRGTVYIDTLPDASNRHWQLADPTPFMMAAAGFFRASPTSACCVLCKAMLQHLEPGMDPLAVHSRQHSPCPYPTDPNAHCGGFDDWLRDRDRCSFDGGVATLRAEYEQLVAGQSNNLLLYERVRQCLCILLDDVIGPVVEESGVRDLLDRLLAKLLDLEAAAFIASGDESINWLNRVLGTPRMTTAGQQLAQKMQALDYPRFLRSQAFLDFKVRAEASWGVYGALTNNSNRLFRLSMSANEPLVRVPGHEHPLARCYRAGWTCNLRRACTGKNDLGRRFRCEKCDYDECEYCILAHFDTSNGPPEVVPHFFVKPATTFSSSSSSPPLAAPSPVLTHSSSASSLPFTVTSSSSSASPFPFKVTATSSPSPPPSPSLQQQPPSPVSAVFIRQSSDPSVFNHSSPASITSSTGSLPSPSAIYSLPPSIPTSALGSFTVTATTQTIPSSALPSFPTASSPYPTVDIEASSARPSSSGPQSGLNQQQTTPTATPSTGSAYFAWNAPTTDPRPQQSPGRTNYLQHHDLVQPLRATDSSFVLGYAIPTTPYAPSYLEGPMAGDAPTVVPLQADQLTSSRQIVGSEFLTPLPEISPMDLELDPKPIGSGIGGVVRRGLWRGGLVAVKQIKTVPYEEEEMRQRFIQECALLAKTSHHSHVVKFVGCCTQLPNLMLISQFCEHGSVLDWLKKTPSCDFPTLVRIMKETAAGLLHLHAEQVVHRDVAARNVLLDARLSVYVTDFGMARVKEACRNYGTTYSHLGPIKWMAPECFSEKKYSFATDVWAFGVYLFELLTRAEPYPGMDLLDVAVGVKSRTLKPLLPADMHPVVADILTRSWSYDPTGRPTMQEIFTLLHRFAEAGCK